MFYTYVQNNSFGTWDDTVGKIVIIEADTAGEADAIAITKGIYFDGCQEGKDCDCCGDRWAKAWEDGSSTPKTYGDEVTEGIVKDYWHKGIVGWLYYKDGYTRPLHSI